MSRIVSVALLCLAATLSLTAQTDTVISGKLLSSGNLQTSAEQLIQLNGDTQTTAVLHDQRLAGSTLELHGHYEHGVFQVNPRHTKTMFVKKDGKLLAITYWCDVCSIRSYAPGLCVCCQQETHLDLRDPTLE